MKNLHRKILPTLVDNMDNDKIIILTGPRQVGKTSLMHMLHQNVDNGVFIDLDIASNRAHFASLESFISFIMLHGYNTEITDVFYCFIDEFQTVPGIGNILKNVYDNYKNIKIVASGSSSLSIKHGIRESLAGRKRVFEILPLDFEEFLIFKGDTDALTYYANIQKVDKQHIAIPEKLMAHLEEFMIFGGYPEVALTHNKDEKRAVLQNIFDLYLEKDIFTFSDISAGHISQFKQLVEILAVENGGQINFDSLSKEIGIHNKTVRNYVELLKDTYLIQIVRPFATNKKKEILKTPKIYFIDNGVRNFFINNFSDIHLRIERGELFESFVLQELMKNNKSNASIKYWRTKNGQEVDFVIEVDGVVYPIEIKFRAKNNGAEISHLLYFMHEYNIDNGWVIAKKGVTHDYLDKKSGKKILYKTAFEVQTIIT